MQPVAVKSLTEVQEPDIRDIGLRSVEELARGLRLYLDERASNIPTENLSVIDAILSQIIVESSQLNTN
ncbi:hypothetical protein [Alteromonas sp. RKMC-009]|uniref:hypothetical protein n=1 Tax=Alteromonas sp. RKMC-009 TaxID=2267264 RepID=UPI000E69FB49|nr:hypothetical protein [Alteromonas sp. RKMC-009]AYA64784.1 hypothetical protein DS731_12630 [Alteromonas sp. RKMC-009]